MFISKTTKFTISNRELNLILKLRLSDTGGINLYDSIPDYYKSWSCTITSGTSGSSVNIKLVSELFQDGYKFYFDKSSTTKIKQFRELVYASNYIITISVSNTKVSTKVITETISYTKIECLGDGAGSSKFYGNPPLKGINSRYLQNNMILKAGTVGLSTLEVRTFEDKLTNSALTDYKKDIKFPNLNVLSIKKGGMKSGQYEFTFRHTKA